jgi:transcriptional regulator with XRE-family HTH domain
MQKKGAQITSREIGTLIKRRRSELGISQEELAAALGVTYQQVQRYESGQNKLNVENVQQVAVALSVPVSYFFGAGEPLVVAERPAPYLYPEESSLLKYFRKIKDEKARSVLVQVAKASAAREQKR